MNPQVREANSVSMTEFAALKRISACIAENKQQLALEVGVKNMVVKASKVSHQISPGKDFDQMPLDKGQNEEQCQRLDAIYDDECNTPIKIR